MKTIGRVGLAVILVLGLVWAVVPVVRVYAVAGWVTLGGGTCTKAAGSGNSCSFTIAFGVSTLISQYRWVDPVGGGDPWIGCYMNKTAGGRDTLYLGNGFSNQGAVRTDGLTGAMYSSMTCETGGHANAQTITITSFMYYGEAAPTATPTLTLTPTSTASSTPTSTFTPSPTATNTRVAYQPGCVVITPGWATATKTPFGNATLTPSPTVAATDVPGPTATVVSLVVPPSTVFRFNGNTQGWDLDGLAGGYDPAFGRSNGSIFFGSREVNQPYQAGEYANWIYPIGHSWDWVITGYVYVDGVPPVGGILLSAWSYGLWHVGEGTGPENYYTGWGTNFLPINVDARDDRGGWLPFTFSVWSSAEGQLISGEAFRLSVVAGGSGSSWSHYRLSLDDIEFLVYQDDRASRCNAQGTLEPPGGFPTVTRTPTRTPSPTVGAGTATYTPAPSETATRTPSPQFITPGSTASATVGPTRTGTASLTPGPSMTPGPSPTLAIGQGTPFTGPSASGGGVGEVALPCNELACVGVVPVAGANPCIGFDSFTISTSVFDPLSLWPFDHWTAAVQGVMVCLQRYELVELRIVTVDLGWLLVLVLTGMPVLSVINMLRHTKD